MSLAAMLVIVLVVGWLGLSDRADRSALRPFADSARVILGELRPDASAPGLQIETGPLGRALIVKNVQIAASAYPVLRYQFDAPDTLAAYFAWRRADQPKKLHYVALPAGGRVLDLRVNPDWRGTIIEMGFALDTLHGLAPDDGEWARVQMALWPGGARAALLRYVGSWLRFENWSGRSINHLGWSLLPALLAAWAVMAALLAWALARDRRLSASALALFVGLALGWVVLEGLWARRLVRQGALTQARYTAESQPARLSQGADAPLVDFTRQAMEVLEAEGLHERIFFLSEERFYPERARYLMLPYPVIHLYGLNQLKQITSRLRPGDALIVAPDKAAAMQEVLAGAGRDYRRLMAAGNWWLFALM